MKVAFLKSDHMSRRMTIKVGAFNESGSINNVIREYEIDSSSLFESLLSTNYGHSIYGQ